MSDLIPVYARWLRAAGRSEETITKRVRLLDHAERHLPHGLDEAHTDDLAAYLATPGWSRWTRHTYWGHLHGLYSWGVRTGHYTLDPTAALDAPPPGDAVPDPLTDEQLARLMAVTIAPWPLVVVLGAYAGLRASEIGRLDREDVTRDRIRVRGKGDKVRLVDTHPLIWDRVEQLPPGPMIGLSGKNLGQRAHYLFRRLGIRHGHLHQLRHWFATTALTMGADLETLRQLLGHASLDTTKTYLLVSSPRRRAAVHAIPAVVGGHRLGVDQPVPPAA